MVTLVVLCLAYVLSQFYRSFLTIVAPKLSAELGLGPAELGALSGAWFGAFSIAQFPIGWALDTLGARRTIAGSLLCAIAGAFLFASAQGFAAMLVAMALIGIGCGPLLMGSMFVFGRAYPPDRFAMLSSMVLGVGVLGVLIAATPLAYAVEAIGWRACMAGIGGLTALAAVGVFLLVRDPRVVRRPGAQTSAWQDLRSIVALRPLWFLLPVTFMSYAVVAAERSLWIGPYLLDVHGHGPIERGNGVLVMSIAMALGAFLYGPAERLLGGPKPTVLIGSFVTAGGFLALGFFPALSVAGAVAALAVIGAFGLTYAILMAHARLFFPEHLLGRGVTFINFVFISGAGLVQAASGLFMQLAIENGTPHAVSFARLHLSFGAMLLVATLLYLAAPARPLRPAV